MRLSEKRVWTLENVFVDIHRYDDPHKHCFHSLKSRYIDSLAYGWLIVSVLVRCVLVQSPLSVCYLYIRGTGGVNSILLDNKRGSQLRIGYLSSSIHIVTWLQCSGCYIHHDVGNCCNLLVFAFINSCDF